MASVLTPLTNLVRANPAGVDIYAKDNEAGAIFAALKNGELIIYPGKGVFWFKTEGASEAYLFRMWGDGLIRTYQVRGYRDFFTVQWLKAKTKLEIRWTTANTRRVSPWDLVQISGPIPGSPQPIVPAKLAPEDIHGENIGTGPGLIYKDTVNGVLRFRKLKGSSGVTITTTGDDVTIAAPLSSGLNEQREMILVDADMATRKWLDLLQVPYPPHVELTVKGGPDQFQGSDFALISNGTDTRRLSWAGLGLDGLVAVGDRIEIEYNYSS